MDDVARNIEAVQRLEQAYNQREYDTVRGTLASDFVAHTLGSETLPNGVEGAIASNEGDRVVSHVRMWGTNDGDMPFGGISKTGKQIDMDWIQISRFGEDGRIHETWAQMDLPTMMVQLGAMPAPEGM
jgi:hypothetical protein